MPRRSKGPRLWLRPARPERGSEAVWLIRDGAKQISTGRAPERLHGPDGAEAALADYIAGKWTPDAIVVRTGDPASVLVAEVLAFYAQKRAPKVADPVSAAIRLRTLGEWWGESTLADVRMSTCEAYIAHRITQPLKQAKRGAALDKRVTVAAARRELEDLSSAIGFWAKEYPLSPRPIVSLPEKGESPRDALTRHQGARLLKAAMGYRWVPDPNATGAGIWKRLGKSARANRLHLRRFVLLGFYTGSRPGVNTKLLWEEGIKTAWVDLEAGVIYRRGRGERDHKTKRRPMVRIPDRMLAHMRRWRRLDLALNEGQGGGAEREGNRPQTLTQQGRGGGDGARGNRQAPENYKPAVFGGMAAATPTPAGSKGAIQTAGALTVLHHGGRPLAGKIRTGFEGIVRDAGLDAEVTPHWLRHTAATWLMERGVPIWDASAYLGMTTATLEKCYGHHRPDHQDRARKAHGRR